MTTLKGSTMFSVIYLNQGYYQIDIKEENMDKTKFIIMKKTYIFKRMPFRICNAPATFQRAINIIFDKIKNVVIDMDDILIFTETKEKHYEVLEKTLGLLKENGVSINFEKSNFSQEEIKFLGHKINKDGIKPVISKLESCSTTRISIKKHSQKPHGFINWF